MTVMQSSATANQRRASMGLATVAEGLAEMSKATCR